MTHLPDYEMWSVDWCLGCSEEIRDNPELYFSIYEND